MMYAKLIIYQQDNRQFPVNEPIDALTTSPANHSYWALTADNLTNGKLTELLLCLDELGFSDVVSEE